MSRCLSSQSVGHCFHRGLLEMNLTLFLLLGLTACWTGLVQSEDIGSPEIIEEELVVVTPKAEDQDKENNGDVAGSGNGMSQTTSDLRSTLKSVSESPDNEETAQTETETDADADADTEEKDLNTVMMIIIPLVLTVVISVIVCVVIICCRWRIKDDTKEDAYLDDEDHEKVPMPMFEDDIPSVMELEMEDLENWIAKDGGKKVDTGQI